MDETQSSKVSDAAASRKRRSSILKSQRAPRTPFSELEFNVATPTDAGKSRRVSFSRRMGVAEFVTNEATTTWKNLYEEHNKSLESSGNESGANGARPSISHIGKRIFDQQFEEVEAVDFGSALIPGNSRAAEFNISINNVNLTQQLAALECIVDDKKITAPQQHFELSSLTDHQSKVFSDDLTIPVMGEMSNQINVNFSILTPMGIDNDKCDDLDEIQKDLERSHNVVCPGPFTEQNMSDYIEVDLNMTHVAIANDESDMSITDTVRSPKVQQVSSSISSNKTKQTVEDKDWTIHKENIAVFNPYVAPRESDNFAINEVPDQVLIFDGKSLKVQSENNEIPVAVKESKRDRGSYRQTLLPNAHLANTPQRKTIVLNINDDLPNFGDDPILLERQDVVSANAQELKKLMIFDEGDSSSTQAVQNIVEPSDATELSNKRKTIVCGNTTGNISLTQAVPNNVLLDDNVTHGRRKTIIYDDSDGNVSVTQANLDNVIFIQNNTKDNEIIEIGNLSISKPIPNKIFEIENDILKTDIEKFTNLTEFGEKILLHDTTREKPDVDLLVYQAKTHGTSEMQINKTNDADDLKDKESNLSVGIEKMDSTMAKSVNSLSSIDNNSEVIKEKDFNMQLNLENEDVVADFIEEKIANCTISQTIEGNKSIVHQLLDMSSTSVFSGISDKGVVTKVDTEMFAVKSKKSTENNSNDAIFVITGNSDEKIQTDKINCNEDICTVKILNVEKLDDIENRLLPALDCDKEGKNNLKDKLFKFKPSIIHEKKKSPPQNRYYEKILSSDLHASYNQEIKNISDVNDTKTRKTFKEADNTKELLEIISNFTDRKSVVPIQGDDKVVPQIKLRRSVALEHKSEIMEPKRLSFASNRQSIVLTREELLNNLSIAQATLQQSRFHIEDSEIDDTATESPTEINESINSPKKCVRMSNEVVKTLHFEDESYSDMSLKSEVKVSPLKKTAFGETSYMKDSKANVIPTYLKDVSDNIKALMNDLVKPSPDQMPFEVISIPKTKKEASTCSTQIQANLVTSSQIDLNVELNSNVNSAHEFNKLESLVSDIADKGNKAVASGLKGHVSAVADVSEIDEGNKLYAVKHEGKSSLKKHSQEPVLIFDHHNPLNNVLLAPPNCVDIHKYNPMKLSEALCAEDNTNISNNVGETNQGNQYEVEKVITQYNVESLVGLQSGDACTENKGDSHTLFSDPSKPLSMDRSTEGFTMEVKTTEINTVIAMKGNKELLEASSSLTLVDDALTQNVLEFKMETRTNNQNSPVKVIYKIDNEDVSMIENIDSDLVSNDDESMESPKTRKRSYSPSRRDLIHSSTLTSPDVTPKPVNKMQKVSASPKRHDNVMDSERDATEKPDKIDSNSEKSEPYKKRSSKKSKHSPKYKKPGTDLTVQQLITEYKITKMEQDMIEDQIIAAIHDRMALNQNEIDIHKIRGRSPDTVSSCTSSKDQNEMQEACVKGTVSYVGSQPSKVDWRPDLKELSSSTLLGDFDSGVNVVAKIDMLPFMGSKECEWETSGGDTWVFRLLRARLRLRVRLAHRHHNALRTRVRADTPVAEICVDTVPVEEKDPLAELCVRFAAEAMRYECGRGCASAGGVPLVLRRCAGVARVALRWARAMRDARTRLAYALTDDGVLTLKVANIPLRSVWEVAMRLELVVEDACEAAWPRASDVRVRCVLADCAVDGEETARALQPLSHDWGHAPRTVWKIFRYLKNKTPEDDFLRL